MAEVVGLVASTISISRLICQIFETVQKIHRFYNAVKDAPQEMKDTLDELEAFSQILLEFQADGNDKSATISGGRCFRSCRNAADDLMAVVVSLEEGLQGNKSRRQWASIKKVLKKETIREMQSKLERAKSTLNLVVSLLIYRQIVSNPVSKAEPDSSLNIGGVKLATDTSTKLRVAELPNCNMISARLLHARSWWLGLGWYSYQSTSIHIVQKQPKEAINSKDKVIIDQKFIPRFRLFANGLWIQSTRIHGNWQYTFRPIRIIPRTAPIFEACRNGDLEQVIYLFRDGSVTIFDTTQSGWTLLHESAKFSRPIVCRWLIAQGADCSATTMNFQRTPLHVAVRNGHGELPYQSSKCTMSAEQTPLQDDSCSNDEIYETVRILVEEGQCDPMMTDYRNRSALHCYREPVGPFNYLIHLQQHFQIDLGQRCDNNQTVMQYHAVRDESSPNIVRAVMGHGPIPHNVVYAKNDSGSTWLMCIVIRLAMAFSKEQSLDPYLGLLGDLIEAGADLNTCNNQGATPLDRVLAFHLEAEDRQPLIHRWFQLLLSKNVNLHSYARQEENLHSNGKVKDVWTYRRGIERYFNIRYGQDVNDITINVQDHQVPFRNTTHIPGAWDAEVEYAQSLGRILIENELPSADWCISTAVIKAEISST